MGQRTKGVPGDMEGPVNLGLPLSLWPTLGHLGPLVLAGNPKGLGIQRG